MIWGFKHHLRLFVLAMHFLKFVKYAITNEKVSYGLQSIMNINTIQFAIQVCLTCPKNSTNGRVEWTKAYLDT
jgi:hypothetical protein